MPPFYVGERIIQKTNSGQRIGKFIGPLSPRLVRIRWDGSDDVEPVDISTISTYVGNGGAGTYTRRNRKTRRNPNTRRNRKVRKTRR